MRFVDRFGNEIDCCISFDTNTGIAKHLSISPEENAENCAQNEQLRRSGDTGDICL
jgi:hypothetical protein